jgi:hypothetical protein
MPEKRRPKAGLRARHDREIAENQRALRASITETERLVGESERMIARHRTERAEGDEDAGEAE